MRSRTTPLAIGLVVAGLTITACGSSSSTSSSSPATSGSPAAATGPDALAGVCPSTVVIQEDWQPEAEHSGLYALVGPGYTIDANKKRVIGPLTIDGKDTGVKIEIRAGGSSIGFQSVTSAMYVDKSITLGAVTTDAAVGSSGNQPVTAVVSQLNKSPQMLMWDPASHPAWKTVKDIGASKATIVVAKGSNYIPLLEQEGLIQGSQVDTSYTGAPARFVSQPKIAQQGFATAEPYIYEHEVKQWNKPIDYQLLYDVGYHVYPEALSVRSGDLSAMSPCLKKLVPILQQSQIDYLKNPGPANQVIVDAVGKYNDGWTYDMGVANFAAGALISQGIAVNDSSGPFGGMDMSRVQDTINTFAPILGKAGGDVKKGLQASGIATDAFIDPSIKLG